MRQKQRGYISFLLLFIVVFALFLTGGINLALNNNITSSIKYVLVNPPTPSQEKTLQLQNLQFIPGSCDPGYLESGEPNILYAASPGPNEIATANQKIKLWYIDETALTMGIGNISQMQQHPVDHVINPVVGDTSVRDPFGFPLFPALFIIDVTYDPENTQGDATHNGQPHPPSEIWGTWKESNTRNDPPKNYTNLGGGDPIPSQPTIKHSSVNHDAKNFSSEIEWNINDLGLEPGHSYRIQFVLHDGDVNKTGGDIGIGCTTVVM